VESWAMPQARARRSGSRKDRQGRKLRQVLAARSGQPL